MTDYTDYSLAQLDQLIHNAIVLGFWDDVKHWRSLRAEKLAGEREGSKS